MKESRIARAVSRLLSYLRRLVSPKIEEGKTQDGDGTLGLIEEILKDPTKQMAVLNYLESKERLEHHYNMDSQISDTYLDDTADPELSDASKVREIILEEIENDRDQRSDRLEALGVNTAEIDALKINSDQLTEIISAVRPDTAQETGLRLLPILRIHDTDFYVDLEKLEFRQVDNSKNAISFRDVHDHWTYTSVLYDPQTKNVFRGSEMERNGRPDLVLVQLPARTQLDAQYWADRVTERAREQYLKARATNGKEANLDENSEDKQLNRTHRRSL